MELRLLIAFILMGGVLFLTPYFYKNTAPPPEKKQASVPAAEQAEPKPQPPSRTPPPKPGAEQADPAQPVAAEAEQKHVVDTSVFQVEFSNRGAVAQTWKLKKYRDGEGRPLDLINRAAEKVDDPFALHFKEQKPPIDLNQALYAVKQTPDGLDIEFTFSDGRISARKRFRFERDSYQLRVITDVRENGRGIPHYITWRGGFGDNTVHGAAAAQKAVYFDLAANTLETADASKAKDGPVTFHGNYSFLGMADNYFAAVLLPERSAPLDLVVFSDAAPSPINKEEQPHPGVAAGGWPYNTFYAYIGPKDLDVLGRVNPKLTQLVDFGWFAILAKPLFMALHWMYDHGVRNWGWAIVIITVIINFLLFPLKLSSLKSMKKMSALQPQIAAINERYRNIGLRDPRKAQQNQEVMELYKKHGVNPMGGCVPMLLQIPFFIAFYNVLSNAIELRHANWLWVSDLSQPEHLAIRILPLAMIASQFVMQKMTPTTTMDPTQQKMMLFMPLMLGFLFYGVASGLVLYWLTGNLVSIAQQWFINKTATASVPPPTPVKRTGRN
jgi:YidC/Oxa1 family membrane protein insertase